MVVGWFDAVGGFCVVFGRGKWHVASVLGGPGLWEGRKERTGMLLDKA